jgi:photosystem II stability/assembly factor-like uncharacterized protein
VLTGLVAIGLVVILPTVQAQQSKNPVLDGKDRLQRFDKYTEMKSTSAFKELKWQFLGPANISGRCTDVAVVEPKGKSYTLYVATASGGVWKTDNEGASWTPVFDQQASTAIGDIALDPTNSQVLWVGTGEANIFRSSQSGCGIFKTADGGKTWQHMGLENTFTIARIVIHPKNPDIIYVAASGHEWTTNPDRGVFKTTDGGKTWNKVLYVNEMTGANDLIMDPSDPNTLYATTWQRIRQKWNDPRNEADYTGSGIWKTTIAENHGNLSTPVCLKPNSAAGQVLIYQSRIQRFFTHLSITMISRVQMRIRKPVIPMVVHAVV